MTKSNLHHIYGRADTLAREVFDCLEFDDLCYHEPQLNKYDSYVVSSQLAEKILWVLNSRENAGENICIATLYDEITFLLVKKPAPDMSLLDNPDLSEALKNL